MDIWMTICRKQATCNYCNKPVLNLEFMVKGSQWRKFGGDGTEARRWKLTYRWHPECWVEQGKAELARRPRVETRGRPFDTRTSEDRTARNKILRRRSAVVQRVKNEVAKPQGEQSFDKLSHLGDVLASIKEEIEKYGGPPESWR